MIVGILMLIGLVSTFHWVLTLKEVSEHRAVSQWEQTAPVGIIILLGIIAFGEVWVW